MRKRRTREEKIKTKLRLAESPKVKEVVEDKADTKVVIKDLLRTGLITIGLLVILGIIYWRLR